MKATATITGLVLLLVPAPVAAQDHHGVIAFGEIGQSDGVAYGFAWNLPARDAAHAEAMNACMSSGGTNCIQVAGFQNSCGALAMDRHGNAQGKPGMTQEQAEARALQGCEAAFGDAGCNIVGSVCTAPDGDPGTYSGSENVLPAQMAQTTVKEPEDGSPAREEPALSRDAQAAVTGPVDELLAREERVLIQHALNALGFDAGSADGIFGPRTLAAIYYWQRAGGHETTGQLTRDQAAFLLAVEVSPEQEEDSPPIPDKVSSSDHGEQPQPETVGSHSGSVLVFGSDTGDCVTDDEKKMDAIEDFLYRHYGDNSLILYYVDGNPDAFRLDVAYYVDRGFGGKSDRFRCRGIVLVDNACQVTDLFGNSLEAETARRQAISCEDFPWPD